MSGIIVLITGANQGLGLECVKKLAREAPGCTILLGSRNLEKGQKGASEVTDVLKGNIVEVVQLDVSSDESISEAAKMVEAKYGRLDVLLNNAGIASTPATTTRQKMLDIFDTNVAAVVTVTDAFIPLLKKSSAPRIVMMSSDLGSIGNTLDPKYAYYFVDNKPYKCSKAALNMLGAMYSVHLQKDGFRVNVVNPGFRQTNLNSYNEHAGQAADGAIEACRLIMQGDKGETGTYTEIEGPIRW